MKRIILITLLSLIFSSVAMAAPFLVCDPQTGVTHYKLTGPAWVPLTSTAQADGSMRLDLVTSTTGANALTVAACKSDAVWGELCSSTTPFTFTRPAAPVAPVNTHIVP